MIIKSIYIENFRNFESETFELSPGTNLVYGENAQGKTNFLESVFYLTCARSFRGVKDRDLVRTGISSARIAAEIESKYRSCTIDALLFTDKRRKIAINGVAAKKNGELSSRLRAVLFSPDDLFLIKDGAAARRRFMDMAFSQLRPNYAQLVSKYNRLHEHKTRILRDWREKPSLLDALPAFNVQLAETGAQIIGYRAILLDRITAHAKKIHDEISGEKDSVSFRYKTVSTITDPFAPVELLAEQILRHTETHREAEIASGSSLSGPHKDDVEIYINGKNARTHASQGQTRTAALSLKLAERELFFTESGEYPVLLLDDVLSELDRKRRDYVINKISSGQVIITLCDAGEMSSYEGKAFEIVSGKICR
jgi:DNA replication and repair protein RecF